MVRKLTVAAAIAVAMVLGTGTASAADNGHISGYEGPGYVSNRVESSPRCHDGPGFRVTNYSWKWKILGFKNNRWAWTGVEAAKRDSGPIGAGFVCVTRAAFDAHPTDSWYNNTVGTRGPVG